MLFLHATGKIAQAGVVESKLFVGLIELVKVGRGKGRKSVMSVSNEGEMVEEMFPH